MPDKTRMPIDSDIDLHVVQQRQELLRTPWAILATISAGGALGALARYGLASAWPHPPGRFPWATFVTNVTGCFLIGVLMVIITEVWTAHRLVRPFLGVGVLGGFTTFSTYLLDTRTLVVADRAPLAVVYLFGTLAAGIVAVWLGIAMARQLIAGAIRRRRSRTGTRRQT